MPSKEKPEKVSKELEASILLAYETTKNRQQLADMFNVSRITIYDILLRGERRVQRKVRAATGTRKCLRCQKTFHPEHVNNRLCPTCAPDIGSISQWMNT